MLLVSVLWIASWTNRRTQKALSNRSAAAQLRRSASHLYKIARTAKIYSLHDAIVRVLLQETARVLKRAIKLDPEHVATHEALRNCGEMRAAFDALRQVTLKLRAEHSTDVDPQSLNNYVQTHYVY